MIIYAEFEASNKKKRDYNKNIDFFPCRCC